MTPRAPRTGLAWYEFPVCLLAGVIGFFQGPRWTALLCALLAGIAFGVWRAVGLLGRILEQQQTRDEEPATRRRRPAGSAAP